MMQASKVSVRNSAEIFEHCASVCVCGGVCVLKKASELWRISDWQSMSQTTSPSPT